MNSEALRKRADEYIKLQGLPTALQIVFNKL